MSKLLKGQNLWKRKVRLFASQNPTRDKDKCDECDSCSKLEGAATAILALRVLGRGVCPIATSEFGDEKAPKKKILAQI